MRSVYKWYRHPVEMLGYSFISCKHEVFNQLVGRPSFLFLDTYRIPFAIKLYLGFYRIKLYSASIGSALFEDLGKFIHLLEHRNQSCILLFFLFIIVNYDLANTCIGHPLINVDN